MRVNTQIKCKKMSEIIITQKDHFVFLDVTRICKSSIGAMEMNIAHELYAIDEKEAEFLIEDTDVIPSLIKQGYKIVIEVGHLPKKYHPKDCWKDTEKEMIGGYWYVRIADVN